MTDKILTVLFSLAAIVVVLFWMCFICYTSGYIEGLAKCDSWHKGNSK